MQTACTDTENLHEDRGEFVEPTPAQSSAAQHSATAFLSLARAMQDYWAAQGPDAGVSFYLTYAQDEITFYNGLGQHDKRSAHEKLTAAHTMPAFDELRVFADALRRHPIYEQAFLPGEPAHMSIGMMDNAFLAFLCTKITSDRVHTLYLNDGLSATAHDMAQHLTDLTSLQVPSFLDIMRQRAQNANSADAA